LFIPIPTDPRRRTLPNWPRRLRRLLSLPRLAVIEAAKMWTHFTRKGDKIRGFLLKSRYGSIPIDTFLVGWTSINPSYDLGFTRWVLTHPQVGWFNQQHQKKCSLTNNIQEKSGVSWWFDHRTEPFGWAKQFRATDGVLSPADWGYTLHIRENYYPWSGHPVLNPQFPSLHRRYSHHFPSIGEIREIPSGKKGYPWRIHGILMLT